MTRHERRKAAKAKREATLEYLANAERSRRIAETVKANKSAPKERNYYAGIRDSLGSLQQEGVFRGRGFKRLRSVDQAFLPRQYR